eukprot:m.351509 g.351509  ORF g.351509 m.351509 type:complete len:61 (+) comp20702_c0_seq4:1608-1790(+)
MYMYVLLASAIRGGSTAATPFYHSQGAKLYENPAHLKEYHFLSHKDKNIANNLPCFSKLT